MKSQLFSWLQLEWMDSSWKCKNRLRVMNEKNTSRSRMLVAGIQFSKNAVLGDKNRKETNSSQQKKATRRSCDCWKHWKLYIKTIRRDFMQLPARLKTAPEVRYKFHERQNNWNNQVEAALRRFMMEMEEQGWIYIWIMTIDHWNQLPHPHLWMMLRSALMHWRTAAKKDKEL